MISHLIDPAILGFILIGVMLFSIFIGFPISFTLIFLGFVFGYLGFGKLVFYLMTLQFSMVMTEQTLAAVPLFVFMGIMMEQAGLMERLFSAFQLMLAKVRGSLYYAVLFVSVIFAAATGIVGASVTILGIMAAKSMNKSNYDVRLAAGTITAGGTLGIFLAQALQARGLKTAVVERGALRGRDQEWNISRKELMELVELDVLSESQLEGCISREFNPVEAAFHGSQKIVTKNVLNLGVSPKNLIEQTLKNYKSMGGLVLDSMPVSKVFVHPNGIQVRFGSSSGEPEKAMAGKLLVDCMGNQSPIVRQVRHGRKPDGVCLVVGSCCRGFRVEENQSGDVICTVSPSEPPDSGVASGQRSLHNLQLFWEAFPAGSGPTDRTTYMFTYLDASSERPSFLHLMEHYWKAMPAYQQVELDDMDPLRILFGLFPTYKDAPLAPSFDRILAIGDASGMQSPLSFGGFAALLRHLGRLTDSIEDAIQLQCTDKGALKYINAYNPSLSGAWMLQKAMSIPATARKYDVDFINRLLGGNFAVMKEEGEELLRPFLQDVIQAIPLTRTLFGQMKADPLFVPAILARVGPGPLSDWLVHYIGLLAYTVMYRLSNRYGLLDVANNLPDRQKFILRRAVERWQYGSGLDIDAP